MHSETSNHPQIPTNRLRLFVVALAVLAVAISGCASPLVRTAAPKQSQLPDDFKWLESDPHYTPDPEWGFVVECPSDECIDGMSDPGYLYPPQLSEYTLRTLGLALSVATYQTYARGAEWERCIAAWEAEHTRAELMRNAAEDGRDWWVWMIGGGAAGALAAILLGQAVSQ